MTGRERLRIGLAAIAFTVVGGASVLGRPAGNGGGQIQVPTTLADFFQPGTQPETDPKLFRPISSSTQCEGCHGNYLDLDVYDEPFDGWKNSLMAQSARDPVWHAALAIANQDADFAGEYCIRCHSPGAWLDGRSVPPDASAFRTDVPVDDFDGVTCHFCHRAVDPVLGETSPPEDVGILAALEFPPGAGRGNGRYVVDPADVRRGPYDDVPTNMHGNDAFGVPVEIIPSEFHRRSAMCATCHDLGNPAFEKQPDGTYALGDVDAPHATQDPHDMFPEQRTYSEWLFSDFAKDGVYFADGRFGGNHPTGVMKDCQDCHMPDTFAGGCFAWEFEPFFPRPDLPPHTFAGANQWVLRAVLAVYGEGVAGISPDSVAAAEARNIAMLRDASDVQMVQRGDELRVRVINWSGHKLPTGYPEGRRMWLNVRFLDESGALVAEHGAYDFDAATLDDSATKVYETKHGMDEEVAAAVNLPAGPSFHLVLNNVVNFDNRIPPVGFTNAAYEGIGAAPVGHDYADGQHWDDTLFPIPAGAAEVVVALNYQSMTREYIEFLRDANETNDAGQLAYDLWADPAVGNKVPPADMDLVAASLGAPAIGDANGDGVVDVQDLLAVLAGWGPCPPPDLCGADLDDSGVTDVQDLLAVLGNWS